MNISTINDKRIMSYKFCKKQPKHMVEIKLNQLISRNPFLINHLNGNISHPPIREVSLIPFNN